MTVYEKLVIEVERRRREDPDSVKWPRPGGYAEAVIRAYERERHGVERAMEAGR